ncbi:phage portal protein [Oceanomicrobium pacificus]|uniref:Phage portal protein n=1 Tax=Oceanomicrobium pacificus TaxID=2692916 RepID=A0A6B0U5Z0_9RHOB|nr:phage portal protein [Oceanomicrobium pacificus]MXU66311.1 phage portal protein [Oceanomicrobium pacificus]
MLKKIFKPAAPARSRPVPVVAPAPTAETKASRTSAMVAGMAGGRPVWAARDSGTLARSGFAGNPVGHRCVTMVAEAAASVGLSLWREGAALTAHPALALLDRPNPAQGRADFLQAAVAHLLLSGDSYLEAAGPDGAPPRELHVLRPDRMRVVPGRDGWPEAYEYRVGGRRIRFDMLAGRPVLHLRSFHPADDHYGLSPLQAAAGAIELHAAAGRWSKALLDNAARPSGAIVYSGADGSGQLGQEQYSRLVDELEAHHQGARNAGRPMLLEGGLDWKPMGYSPADMEYQRTRDAAARDIALALGVPPMLLGLPGDNSYANYQEANRAFYRLTVLPLLDRVTTAIAAWLSDLFGEQLSLVADLDSVTALAGEREALWRRVSAAGFLTDVEKRRLLGLPDRGADG